MGHAVDLSITPKGPLPGVFELPRSYRRQRGGGDGEVVAGNKALCRLVRTVIMYTTRTVASSLRSCVLLGTSHKCDHKLISPAILSCRALAESGSAVEIIRRDAVDSSILMALSLNGTSHSVNILDYPLSFIILTENTI